MAIITAAVLALFLSASVLGQAPPPDGPADIHRSGGRLTVSYDGKAVFSGKIAGDPSPFRFQAARMAAGDALHQVAVLTATGAGRVTLRGEVVAGDDAFPCEADRRAAGLDVVRHTVGLSRSPLNRAVYDRGGDWLLSVDHGPAVGIAPLAAGGGRRFVVEASGREIILRFRPRFFGRHRGLDRFEPWRYRVWAEPVAGWCSWFAFKRDVDEAKIRRTADVLAETLRPFGLDYLQIDDGYQRGQGLPELWLSPNEKFPGGLAALAGYIRARGLRPGIWTNVAFNQHEFAAAHPDWFVRDADGRPAAGNWVDLSLDGANPAAVDALVRPVYRALAAMDWRYFKLDALRHLRYEGYNAHADHFQRAGTDRASAFRNVVAAVREAIGPDRFLLGCWGVRPELIGLIDGCRLGDDGFSFAGLAQYNSFNNVVWRNDPDHIELSPEEAWRSTMVTALTGSLFMVTDRPEIYRTGRVEPARRALPVPVTRPGQLYDVDPSRSLGLAGVHSEVSGSGPRPFDAGYVPRCHLYALEIDRPFENWLVLGRTGGEFPRIPLAEIGLDPAREYWVFEYWTRELKGCWVGEFVPGAIDVRFGCQLFCFRERRPYPQVIATSRHISCGLELADVAWSGGVLQGTSELVTGDPYILYLSEPDGFMFRSISCSGADVTAVERQGGLRICRLLSPAGGRASWRVAYEIEPGR